ncbi:vWA domain-containing protein [Paracoccus alkanivorans]|uniref:VWA domain-containing protein n=1 Tax=Paracoccus alkanivorans TaxID=2116655 RepID=A0A3M0MG14_9RHOB|nr:vWA domain-containing protein [Paracoccus alkanivorans]RMC36616.1 VWA domain-containing protein [Paracoccus alkanivorans]
MMAFFHPYVLFALPFALLPLGLRWLRSFDVPRLGSRPVDARSRLIDRGLPIAGFIAISSLVLGVSGPYLKGGSVPYRGQGSNLVVLIDRSSSMDDSFAGRTPDGGEESKSAAARRILQDFIAGRPDDRIGIAAFSTAPLQVLPMTTSRSAIRAAIDAQAERGLSQTDVGRGLALAMEMMRDSTTVGSRAVVMVSDGAAVIAPDVQKQLRELALEQQVNLYWLYLRTEGAKSIFDDGAPGEANTAQTRPERHLHLFLQRLGITYRAFEAEGPEAVQQAIDEIGKMETRPILTERMIPRRDLDWICYLLAAAAAGILTLARWLERPYAPVMPAPLMRRS